MPASWYPGREHPGFRWSSPRLWLHARKEEEVIALVEKIEREIGAIEVLVFNIGANVPCSILEKTARKYFKIWEMACSVAF